MIATACLLSKYASTRDHAVLLGDIRAMRISIRKVTISVFSNDNNWRHLWNFIQAIELTQPILDVTPAKRLPAKFNGKLNADSVQRSVQEITTCMDIGHLSSLSASFAGPYSDVSDSESSDFLPMPIEHSSRKRKPFICEPVSKKRARTTGDPLPIFSNKRKVRDRVVAKDESRSTTAATIEDWQNFHPHSTLVPSGVTIPSTRARTPDSVLGDVSDTEKEPIHPDSRRRTIHKARAHLVIASLSPRLDITRASNTLCGAEPSTERRH
jgi:hypothetical protein